jgi:DNA polymerase-1
LKLESKIKKTGEAILSELSQKHPHLTFLRKIVDYRHLYKSYRTYLQNLLKFSESDGRIHCTYNQCRVPSGRLASSKPNLQNIPKSDTDNEVKKRQATIIRRSFIPEKNYVLLEADFKQAEFRALAHYSRDPEMIEMINNNRDIHKMIASVSYLKPENQVTDTERKIAKTIVFGIMYGRGAKSIAEALQIPIKEAENIKNTFLGAFKYSSKWISGVQSFVKKTGYVKTLTGRKVTLPEVYSKDKERVAYALRCAINYPIQGIVGDLTNLSGALLFKEFETKNLDAHLIMNIHDSLIVECQKDLVEEVKSIMYEQMENKTREILGLRVNIKIDIAEGQNLSFK